ncbi:50S ribosomal protein 5, chloroplastic [Heracleum sosnowskyi]|uniref:50S ribosomal protein 5, chloroplastic n=1 Tax=Heracleum sosnowskyi TaxID=360622 RepID=A0AAD8J0S3_9APIA|nr:50S ribosomal protein 5, chloroplastic [Heracleum sosnowskyi]
MALVLFTAITPHQISLPSSSSSVLPFASLSSSRLGSKFGSSKSKLSNGVQICTPFVARRRGSFVVKASAEIDGTGSDAPETPSESKEETVPVENLPLESKLQLKLEAKIRMKLAKKIRLRRKRLVRKRHLRKKGRWPPSKMKKNKNV